MPKFATIYGVFDHQGRLRYIGKANDVAARQRGHIRSKRKSVVGGWLRAVLARKEVVEFRSLVCCISEDWQSVECEMIATARAEGHPLLNVADGGDEPKVPNETRAENGRKVARAIHDDAKRPDLFSCWVGL